MAKDEDTFSESAWPETLILERNRLMKLTPNVRARMNEVRKHLERLGINLSYTPIGFQPMKAGYQEVEELSTAPGLKAIDE